MDSRLDDLFNKLYEIVKKQNGDFLINIDVAVKKENKGVLQNE